MRAVLQSFGGARKRVGERRRGLADDDDGDVSRNGGKTTWGLASG
jgi:hypothetical protein